MDDNFEQTISKALQAAALEASQAPFRRAAAELTAIADGIDKLRNMDLVIDIPSDFAAAVARVHRLIEVKTAPSPGVAFGRNLPSAQDTIDVSKLLDLRIDRIVRESLDDDDSPKTLPEVVLEVLRDVPDTPFSTSEVYRILKARGWTSESEDPKNVVNNALVKLWRAHDHVIRPGRGLYTWATELPGDHSGSLGDRPEPNDPTVSFGELVTE